VKSDEDTCDIVVWVHGHTTGNIFRNKSKRLAEEIITCVGNGKGFKLSQDGNFMMGFGPGMVSHVQVMTKGEQ
jgi:hypothetical protein